MVNNIDSPTQLATFICKHAVYLRQFINGNYDKTLEILKDYKTTPDLDKTIQKFEDDKIYETEPDVFASKLQLFKTYEYIKITAKELLLYPIEDITLHISTVAKIVLELAYRYSYKKQTAKHGLPKDSQNQPIEFAVIGLGKLGANELNYSSDIDIIFVYSSDGSVYKIDGEVNNSISVHEFFCELSKLIIKYIANDGVTEAIFRVDTRLRPGGDQGAVAQSLNGYRFYYESYGETWERMMLLKGNFAAGSKVLAEEFKKAVYPFIFRKSLDHRFIDEVSKILQKVQTVAAVKYKGQKNVKLGTGGIRSIEFFAQMLQLLNYPKVIISTPNTLVALKELSEKGIISQQDREFLDTAYRFYRNLEHKAQMENDRQVYVVPESSPDYPLYLERAGFTDKEIFEQQYAKYSEGVSKIFKSLVGDGAGGQLQDNITQVLFDGLFDMDETVDMLSQLGCVEPEKVANTIYHIFHGKSYRDKTPHEKEILKNICTQLIISYAKNAKFSIVMNVFRNLFLRQSTVYFIYELYVENRKTIDNLVNIFTRSRFLTDVIIGNNNVLTHLFETSCPKFTKDEYIKQYKDIIASDTVDLESELDIVRHRHKEALFKVGYSFINKEMSIIDLMSNLTEIASAMVELAFTRSNKELQNKYGRPITNDNKLSQYIVVGMGKLGSGEMSFASDLDLIVLFDADGHCDTKSQTSCFEYYHRLVQRATAYLSTITSYGFLYKIDMNLRPSGASGALVTTIDAFADYQHKTAMVWEKQALLKAKVIYGDKTVGEQFEIARRTALQEVRYNKELQKEIYDMRLRLDKERGGADNKVVNNNSLNDIKYSPGGLTDIEFIVQYLSLKEGIGEQNCFTALNYLHLNERITNRNFELLQKSYFFYRELENIMRLSENAPVTKLPPQGELTDMANEFFGYSSKLKIVEEYHYTRRVVRAAFDRIFLEKE